MPNIRPLNKKYNIGKHRYEELRHFCMQYGEWKEELESLTDTVKAINYSEEIKGNSTKSATEELAIRRAELREKCELVERAALEADSELYEYILEGVTEEYASFKYLKYRKNMPCGKNTYSNRRAKFFCILSKRKK
ncbi:MAG: hypothetical protein K1W34_14125 [Lachnospiraceae bacterium]